MCDKQKNPIRRWKIVAKAIFITFTICTCVASVVGLAAASFTTAFFFDQPRIHCGAALLLATVVTASLRWWRLAIGTFGFFALNFYFILPVVHTESEPTDATPLCSIIHANLARKASPPSSFIAYVDALRPEIVCLQEVTPKLAAQLSAAFPDYSVVILEERSDSRGVAVMVRSDAGLTIQSTHILRFAEHVTDRPHPELQVSLNGDEFRLLSFHCSRPSSAKTIATQSAEYDELSAWFRTAPQTPAIAIGDFNSAPWSQAVRKLTGSASLPSQTGTSIAPTWPSGSLGWAGIPIDLCLHNDGLIIQTEIGPDIGSDHYPIYCRVFRNDTAIDAQR